MILEVAFFLTDRHLRHRVCLPNAQRYLFCSLVLPFVSSAALLTWLALAAADDVITSRLSFDVMTKRSGNIVNLRSTKCLPSFPPSTFLDLTHSPSVDNSSAFVLTQTVDNPKPSLAQFSSVLHTHVYM